MRFFGKAASQRGFLMRLLRDARGNAIALTAAAMVPMIGLVGGAVDVSRMYAVKSRLQSACDAGALAGRRTMGAGLWSANSNRANTVAQNTFNLNYKPLSFGSENVTASFTESTGNVTGTASADVPMTLMKVFLMPTKAISVTCQSQMVIPNTDVMFVLDTTGSMNCPVKSEDPSCTNNGGVEATNAKIKGLRTAVKCFYEALAKLDSSEACPGTAPSGGLSAAVQLRFGFMPYATNVNVGKLLPNSYFADSWTYQSRTVNTTQIWGWTAGTQSGISGYSAWDITTTPSSYNNSSSYSGWATIGSSTVTVGGTTYNRQKTPATSANCASNNTMTGGQLVARSDVSTGIADNLQSSSTPTYPQANQTLTFEKDDTRDVDGYRYRWFNRSGTNGCWLETGTAGYQRRQTGGTATKPLTWTSYQKFVDYTYRPVMTNVSGLKAGGSTWNASLSLPLSRSSGTTTINPSGSTAPTSFYTSVNSTASWGGCIEEAQTFRNTDGDPSDEWSPIPGTAYDADIDLIPNAGDPATQWGPLLSLVARPRYDASSNPTTANVTTGTSWSSLSPGCPDEARKLVEWSDPSTFDAYVNGLSPGGSTYHDVGLIWGARFMSADGIFGAENATTPEGATIQRHMIFMTDGDTSTAEYNYDAHGAEWWDRRQTNTSTDPDAILLNAVVNARFSAVCEAIKNKNITLWVVSYGQGNLASTEARLSACASPGRYFLATDTAALIANFQDIANKISALRLTQ